MNGKEKRRAPRARHDSVIEIFNVEGSVGATGRLVDFSTAGASFSVGDPVVMPEVFRARLRFFGQGVIEVQARVVWIRRDKNATHYGIKFESLTQLPPAEAE